MVELARRQTRRLGPGARTRKDRGVPDLQDPTRAPRVTSSSRHGLIVPAILLAYLGCVAASTTLAVAVDNDTIQVSDPIGLQLVLAGIAVLAFLGGWALSRFSKVRRPERSVSPGRRESWPRRTVDQPSDDEIRTWVDDFYDKYKENEKELRRTARAMLLPSRYVHRAIQVVTLNDLSTTHSVSREFRVPGAYDAKAVTRVILPVLTLKKEELVDALDIECDGNSAPTLGYKESQGASLWLAAVLMTRAGVDGEPFLEALRRIASELPEEPQRLTGTPGTAHALEAAQEVVDLLSRYRFIFVEVSAAPGSRVPVRVQWVVSSKQDRFSTVSDTTRMAFGLGPTSISGAVVGAEAASWHLRVHAPAGSHMKRAVLYLPPGVEPTDFVPTHNRVHGKDLAHVRVRRRTKAMPSYFRVHLGETPPGIGGPLALLATALTATLWLVGFFYDRAFPAAVANEPTARPAWLDSVHSVLVHLRARGIDTSQSVLDHPGGITAAAMLTAISVVSAWLISRFSEDAVRRAQLREVLALFTTMFISFAAVFSAALRLGGYQLFKPWKRDLFGAHVTADNRFWCVIMVLAAGFFLMAWSGLAVRVLRLRSSITARFDPEHPSGVVYERVGGRMAPRREDASPPPFELTGLEPTTVAGFDFTCGGWVRMISRSTDERMEERADEAPLSHRGA